MYYVQQYWQDKQYYVIYYYKIKKMKIYANYIVKIMIQVNVLLGGQRSVYYPNL